MCPVCRGYHISVRLFYVTVIELVYKSFVQKLKCFASRVWRRFYNVRPFLFLSFVIHVCVRFFIPTSHYFWLLALKNLFFSLDTFVASQNVNFVVQKKNVIRIADRNNETTIDFNESEMRYQRFQSAAHSYVTFDEEKKRNKRKCWLALRFKITTNWSVNFAQNPFSSQNIYQIQLQ